MPQVMKTKVLNPGFSTFVANSHSPILPTDSVEEAYFTFKPGLAYNAGQGFGGMV